MKTQSGLLSTAAALVAATLGADAPGAAESSTVLTPQALQEIAQVEVEIDRIEAQTIERLAKLPDNQVQAPEENSGATECPAQTGPIEINLEQLNMPAFAPPSLLQGDLAYVPTPIRSACPCSKSIFAASWFFRSLL